ncbi:O-acetyl-ADP-ribose deacetylase [Phytomonospora endophytica]|uniref:O-acetyl-ADP-ribose deacetylase (Regulator of RNase III) n=1 Tax=Phytomonospora endophytica TaxID=714109 RepID=A0A841FNW0_9ACTN|nr:O-acetyl-ADP-ribose deacetylase [Phytomonospora endophytica]MBB6033630.1 O-acetyl-ADP-ribose deacetylase (regulator of RNase III) [Phytomonospora endophytica]GIG64854.1 macro domain-containing protein [Phytomonospora endophytica]
MRVELVQGDITVEHVDAIVNAANSSLLGGGGVDGAIHRAGGPEILAACEDLRRSHYGRGLPTGEAVATTAGRLHAHWVIHTVGPQYWPGKDQTHLLRSCYVRSLAVADELDARTVAFPLVSAGIYGWPIDDAIGVALGAFDSAETSVEEARLVLFDRETHDLATRIRSGG